MKCTAKAAAIIFSNLALGFAPTSTSSRRIPSISLHSSSNDRGVILDDRIDEEPCIVGDNVVSSCQIIPTTDTTIITTTTDISLQGTQSQLSAATNLGKCICGAGSFALPHVFLNEGAIGGTLAMITCGYLAMVTMQSINTSRYLAVETQQLQGDSSRHNHREWSMFPC